MNNPILPTLTNREIVVATVAAGAGVLIAYGVIRWLDNRSSQPGPSADIQVSREDLAEIVDYITCMGQDVVGMKTAAEKAELRNSILQILQFALAAAGLVAIV